MKLLKSGDYLFSHDQNVTGHIYSCIYSIIYHHRPFIILKLTNSQKCSVLFFWSIRLLIRGRFSWTTTFFLYSFLKHLKNFLYFYYASSPWLSICVYGCQWSSTRDVVHHSALCAHRQMNLFSAVSFKSLPRRWRFSFPPPFQRIFGRS